MEGLIYRGPYSGLWLFGGMYFTPPCVACEVPRAFQSLYCGEPNFDILNFLTHINSSKTQHLQHPAHILFYRITDFLVAFSHTPCAHNVRIRRWYVSYPLVRRHSNNVDTDHRILALAQPVSTELPLRTQPDDSTFEYAHLPLQT